MYARVRHVRLDPQEYGYFSSGVGHGLGEMAEVNLRRAVMMAGPTAIFQRPGSVALLVVAALSFAIPIIQAGKARQRA